MKKVKVWGIWDRVNRCWIERHFWIDYEEVKEEERGWKMNGKDVEIRSTYLPAPGRKRKR